jgi:23S rRNA (adenine2503-C2)-methyltransferase
MVEIENRKLLLGMNTSGLRELAEAQGEPAFRGSQLSEWIYRRGARGFDVMSNLPAQFKDRITTKYTVGRSTIAKEQRSVDGTVKLLLGLGDGVCVETVGLPYEDRYSCCVSTQAGCPIGCVFCATGQSGFQRNLSPGEIVDQVLTINETTKNHVDHVTFMGMGEPLLNYEATVKALRLFNEEMGIGARHLTVSTIGYVPGIRRLIAEDLPVTLAVSLHAATDKLRRKLIPGMTKWALTEIIDACRDYVSQTGRRVTIEYCLIDGINDNLDEAQRLAALLKGLNAHVNLIPFNPANGLPFKPSPPGLVKAFAGILLDRGVQVTERQRRGADIDAACGQLRRREDKTGPEIDCPALSDG